MFTFYKLGTLCIVLMSLVKITKAVLRYRELFNLHIQNFEFSWFQELQVIVTSLIFLGLGCLNLILVYLEDKVYLNLITPQNEKVTSNVSPTLKGTHYYKQ